MFGYGLRKTRRRWPGAPAEFRGFLTRCLTVVACPHIRFSAFRSAVNGGAAFRAARPFAEHGEAAVRGLTRSFGLKDILMRGCPTMGLKDRCSWFGMFSRGVGHGDAGLVHGGQQAV
jgi:hypothetical protein